MSVTSGFFNSVNHDRLYDAEQISSMFDGIILDGIYQGLGDAFIVKPYSDLNCTVTVGTGRAWFDHTWTLNSTELALTLDDPNVLYDRIDAIVIDVDRRQDVRANSIKVVKGTVSETGATKPALIEEELHNQYPLAYVTVKAGSAAPIQAQYIENVIGQTKTPLVAGVLEHMDITMFVQQMEDEFNVWFEGLKDVVSGDSITNLQQQINKINENSIPMKKTLVDIIRDGVPNFSTEIITLNNAQVSGVNLDLGGTYNQYSLTKAIECGLNNQAIILPDGKIARFGFLVDPDGIRNSMGTGDELKYFATVGNAAAMVMYVKIMTEDNVTQLFTSQLKLSGAYMTYAYKVIADNIDADSYPVTLNLIGLADQVEEIADNEECHPLVFVSKITITNDGNVVFDNSISRSETGFQINEYNTYYYGRFNKCSQPAYLENGDLIFVDTAIDLDNLNKGGAIAYRVTSDGVVSFGPRYTDSGTRQFGSEDTRDHGKVNVANVGSESFSTFKIVPDPNTSSNYGGGKVDNTSLTITQVQQGSVSLPSSYRYPRIGSVYSLESGNILNKKSWNYTTAESTSSEGRFVSPAFPMGLSLVTTANAVFITDYEDVKCAILANSGNDSRVLYYDETDKIGVYDYLHASLPSGITAINPIGNSRNKYRKRVVGNKTYYLFDDAGSTLMFKNKGEDTLILLVLNG